MMSSTLIFLSSGLASLTMRLLPCTNVLLFLPVALCAQVPASSSLEQAVSPHQVTPIPDDARFALVQAPFAAKGTFLLDRYLGSVWQLAGPSKDGLYIWQKVPVTPQKTDIREEGTKVNYAIFVSGISLRFTFLVNIRTGASWQFANADGEAIFAPMKIEEQQN